jgi:ABC-type Fe3+/spermidine/putrescine transport system ATPase subunit
MIPETPAIQTIALGKRYGAVTALHAVDLSIEDNQYFVLLGPSGGGKTTLLRLIGGFIRASAGRILLHGQDMTERPPDKRPTSMVFQSYALFPHMSVERNVGYGLRLKKLSRSEIAGRVERMLELVGLTGLNRRMPHELSGGQQQRVQLARSLVLERDVLLLDEPLAALDAKLRKDMCFELKRIQEEVGITFVHVTHNQEEAMTVADRVAIVSDGVLVEEGTPREVYESPRQRFTAHFIGENNLFDGRLVAVDAGMARVDLGFAEVRVPVRDLAPATGDAVCVSVRSELLEMDTPGPGSEGCESLPGTLLKTVYLGLTLSSLVRLDDGTELLVRGLSHSPEPAARPGQRVTVRWNRDVARLHTA